jgi:hypothetical protein
MPLTATEEKWRKHRRNDRKLRQSFDDQFKERMLQWNYMTDANGLSGLNHLPK